MLKIKIVDKHSVILFEKKQGKLLTKLGNISPKHSFILEESNRIKICFIIVSYYKTQRVEYVEIHYWI